MIATRPRGATFSANESPAIPLPRIRKSNSWFAMLELGVIDQARFSDDYGESHVRSLLNDSARLDGIFIEEFNVIDLCIGLLLDEFSQMIFQPRGLHGLG